MSVAEEKFSAKFDEIASEIKHRGAYYQEDASEKGMALLEAKYKDTKVQITEMLTNTEID